MESYKKPYKGPPGRRSRGPEMNRTVKKIRGEIKAAEMRKMKKYPLRRFISEPE